MKKLLLFFSVFASLAINAQGPQATPLITDTTTLRNYINLEIQPNGTKAITAYKMNRILNGYLNCWPFGGTITASQSVLKTGVNLTLLNDALSPGNNKVYGTNSSGTKGWRDGVVSAANGLNVLSGVVELGGSLNKNTTIDLTGLNRTLRVRAGFNAAHIDLVGYNGTTDSSYLTIYGGPTTQAFLKTDYSGYNATSGTSLGGAGNVRAIMSATTNSIQVYKDTIILHAANGKYRIDSLLPTVDIATYKPLVTDVLGNTRRLDYWPIGGGGSSNIATASQTATGDYLHNWAGKATLFDSVKSWNWTFDAANNKYIDFSKDNGYQFKIATPGYGFYVDMTQEGLDVISGKRHYLEAQDSVSFKAPDVRIKGSTRMQGAVYNNVVSATDADYTVTDSDYIITLPNITTTDREIFLPSAASHKGRSLLFYNNDLSTGLHEWIFNIGVKYYGDPAGVFQVMPPLSSLEIFSDGTYWIIKYYNH